METISEPSQIITTDVSTPMDTEMSNAISEPTTILNPESSTTAIPNINEHSPALQVSTNPSQPLNSTSIPPTSEITMSPSGIASSARDSPGPNTRPSSQPPAPIILPPERPNPHGSPTRVYINQHVTPHLLEGMKYIAAYEPEKPLKWLSEFLARRSGEIEGQ